MVSTAEKVARHTTTVQQRTAGNSFFRKAGEESFFGTKENTFFGHAFQPKLTVSSPDDPQEKEADAVAEKIMRMSEPVATPPKEKEEEKLHRKEEEPIDRKEKEEEEKVHRSPENAPVSIQAKEEKEDGISPKLFRQAQPPVSGETLSQAGLTDSIADQHLGRKALSLHQSDIVQCSGRGPPATSPSFEQTLANSKGGGNALPQDTMQTMQGRFGADFSGVRIHTGATAEGLSNSINAQAFTHGNDVYFNSGKFAPETAAGGTLLAHELTHTIQQGASRHVSPSPTSNGTVAARKQRADIHSPTTFRQVNSVHKKPVTQKQKTLRDLRRETFHVDRKEESIHQEATNYKPETGINSERSNWSVNNEGQLHTSPKCTALLPQPLVQAKEEKEEKKEEKLTAGHQPAVQKKTTDNWYSGEATIQNAAVQTSSKLPAQSNAIHVLPSIDRTTQTASTSAEQSRDRGPPSVSLKSNHATGLLQRSWLSNAWNAVSGFVSEAADMVAQGLDAAKQWILRRIRSFVQNIPGYRMLSIILQHDPVTGEPVERSGRNLLLAGLELVPLGGLFRQVLERVNAINEAAAWIEGRIADLLSMVSSIGNRFSNFMEHLSLDDIGNPEAVLNRVADLFRGIFDDVTGFLRNAVVEFLEIIKRIMLRLIVDFVRQRVPRLYPLLRVALGHDPVTGETVERNGTNILYAALDATDAGREQRRQMEETGSFQRIAGWIDRGIAVFTNAYNLLRTAFTNLWSSVTIENLFSPVETFTRIYNDFAAPIALVGNFLRDLAVEIVRAIKDALLRRLRDFARGIRGYSLITVIIGRDPFTGEQVLRTVPNLIRGFMSLMEGGEEQYRQMEESGAIARTVQRVNAAVDRLNMTPAYVIQLFTEIWASFGLNDLAHPVAAFQRVMARFGEPIRRLIDFVIEIVKIVVEVIMQVMNFPTDLIVNIITRAMQAFDLIKRDPIGFLKNLLRAIKQGFVQFFGRIGTHLLSGLTGWLLSELRDANVPAPTDFTLRGVIGWVLQVLGISTEKIWEKLAAHPRIGPERVARIRSMINRLEGIWTFIKDVQERGMAAIWDKIQEQLTRLWDTVLDAIKNWIMERVVNQMVARLLSMLDPTGIMAVVNSAIALYRAIQSFIRYLRQMLEIVNSFVEGTLEIAQGNVRRAADFLERSMARAMPIIIGFLANQVGLSGIGRRVGEMIGRAREMVDSALTWLVNRAVNAGMNFLDRLVAMGRSAMAALRNWWSGRNEFTTDDGEHHAIYFDQSSEEHQLMIASRPKRFIEFVDQIEATTGQQRYYKGVARVTARNLDTRVQTMKSINRQLRSGSVSGTAASALVTQYNQQLTVVNNLLTSLATQTRVFMSGTGGVLPVSTAPIFGGLQNGFAKSMQIEKLTKLGPPGTEPSVYTVEWSRLSRRRRSSGGPYYVLGHLLGNPLHGPGTTWDNLTPLTQDANLFDTSKSHYHKVEKYIQQDIALDKVFRYSVVANYNPRSSLDTLINSSQAKILNPATNPTQKQRLQTIVSIATEEKNIPTTLSIDLQEVDTIGRVKPNGRKINTTIQNTIETAEASYIL